MSRKLEITGISAEGLVGGVNSSTFAVFDFSGDNHWKQSMRTSVDETGWNNPMWEDKLETELWSKSSTPPSFLYVKLYCCTTLSKLGKKGKHVGTARVDKHVGTARVPVKVFTGEYAPEGFLHCLSYRLWDESRRRNGIVNFSVRIFPPKSQLKGGDISVERPFWLRF